MRYFIPFLILLTAGCGGPKRNLELEYQVALKRDEIAYAGADAKAAFEEKKLFIEHVAKLEREGADIPAKHIYVWDYARLGLLAEHLGRTEEAEEFFRVAAANAKKAYQGEPPEKYSVAGLHAALEIMDTPDRFQWRRKGEPKPLHGTSAKTPPSKPSPGAAVPHP